MSLWTDAPVTNRLRRQISEFAADAGDGLEHRRQAKADIGVGHGVAALDHRSHLPHQDDTDMFTSRPAQPP